MNLLKQNLIFILISFGLLVVSLPDRTYPYTGLPAQLRVILGLIFYLVVLMFPFYLGFYTRKSKTTWGRGFSRGCMAILILTGLTYVKLFNIDGRGDGGDFGPFIIVALLFIFAFVGMVIGLFCEGLYRKNKFV